MIKYAVSILLLTVSPLFAATIGEIQELRLTKAELALVDGNEKQALNLISQNMISKNFHFGTFSFLASFYYDKKKYSKSFKVLRHILKKRHGLIAKEIIKLRDPSKVHSILKGSFKPDEDTLEVYFKIASQYFTLSSRESFTDELRAKLLDHATKYYNACLFYQYRTTETLVNLGELEGLRSNYKNSIKHLLKAKERIKKKSSNPEDLNDINLLLGNSLVQTGNIDAGSLFLKSVYFSTKDEGLKDYANSYLDSLASSYLVTSLSLDLTFNSNINSLTSEELESFEQNQDLYISKSGFTTTRNLNSLYSSNRFKKYWNYLIGIDYAEQKTTKRSLSRLDNKSISLQTELKYSNLIKSLAKVSYSYNQLRTRQESEVDYTKYSTTHSFILHYSHTLKSGVINYKLPFNFTVLNSDDEITSLSDKGLSISYTPFTNGLFSPNYSIDWLLDQEDEDMSTSQNLIFTISNQFKINDSRNLFAYTSYTSKSNESPNIAYSEFVINGYLTQAAPFLDGLLFNFSATLTSTSFSNSTSTRGFEASIGSSYSF